MSLLPGDGASSDAPNQPTPVPDEDSFGAGNTAPKELFNPPRWGETAPPEDVRWLIQELIQLRTVNSIAGDPGVGKTRVAIQMAAAVATGTDFAGRWTTPAAALYLNFDDSATLPRFWVERAARGRGHNLTHLPLYYYDPVVNGAKEGEPLENPEILEDVRRWIVRVLEESGMSELVLIVDTFESAFPRKDSNTGNDVLQAYKILHDLIREFPNLTIVVIDHTGKSKDLNGESSSASGSQQKKARVRTEHVLSEKPTENTDHKILSWKVTKVNAARKPPPFGVRFVLDETAETDILEAISLDGLAGTTQQYAVHQHVYARLRHAVGTEIRQKDLQDEAVRMNLAGERTVKEVLKNLEGHPNIAARDLPERGKPKALRWVEPNANDCTEESNLN